MAKHGEKNGKNGNGKAMCQVVEFVLLLAILGVSIAVLKKVNDDKKKQ